jgi:DNA-binding beta-propeller fold protein YncE
MFKFPRGVCVDTLGYVFVADSGNHSIRKITPAGVVTTYAGTPGTPGTVDGLLLNAKFNVPAGLAFDSTGNLYIADSTNHAIRSRAVFNHYWLPSRFSHFCCKGSPNLICCATSSKGNNGFDWF